MAQILVVKDSRTFPKPTDTRRSAQTIAHRPEQPLPSSAVLGLGIGMAIGLYCSPFVSSKSELIAAASAVGSLAGLAADPRLPRRFRRIAAAAALAITAFTFTLLGAR
jgi:hypothetical protein